MINKIKDKILFWGVSIKDLLFRSFKKEGFSQFGEDLVLKEIFSDKSNGVYVDVGAYHPRHYSNTHMLYKKGWSGINIDPNPESIRLFKIYRHGDINLNLGVSAENGEKELTIFNHRACSTFNSEQKEKISEKSNIRELRKHKVMCNPLAEILDENLDKDKEIDFLDIDAEGMSLEVLNSNDWDRYKPRVILIEDDDVEEGETKKTEISNFLTNKGYKIYLIKGMSSIYILE